MNMYEHLSNNNCLTSLMCITHQFAKTSTKGLLFLSSLSKAKNMLGVGRKQEMRWVGMKPNVRKWYRTVAIDIYMGFEHAVFV
jgi:hypothetical protein